MPFPGQVFRAQTDFRDGGVWGWDRDEGEEDCWEGREEGCDEGAVRVAAEDEGDGGIIGLGGGKGDVWDDWGEARERRLWR